MGRDRRTSSSIGLVALLLIASPSLLIAQETEQADDRNWIARTWDRIPHEERDIDWLTGDFNIWSGLAGAAVILAADDAASSSNPGQGLVVPGAPLSDVTKFGDDIYTMIPGTAYVTSLAARDYQGFILMGIHNATSSAIMQGLKDGVGQRRPDDSSNKSFPSGHTNTAFLGAAYLQQRYGPRWGVPAYVAAIAVAWTRVYSNVHYVNDTVAGASIAMMSSWAIVPPYESERRERWADLERFRKMSYEFEMTFNDVDRNLVQAPSPGGDTFTNPIDKPVAEPWANSHVAFHYHMNPRQSIVTYFSPWEIRSFGQFAAPVNFAGETFPAATDIRSTHRLFHYSLQYRHAVVSNERLRLRLGAGVSGMQAKQELFIVDDTAPNRQGLTAEAKANSFYPALHADAELALFWKLLLDAEIGYGSNGDNTYSDISVQLMLRFNRKWSVSAGIREYESEIKDGSLSNDFKRSGPAVNFVYSF